MRDHLELLCAALVCLLGKEAAGQESRTEGTEAPWQGGRQLLGESRREQEQGGGCASTWQRCLAAHRRRDGTV
jgi:hypothetical protein